MDTPETPLDAHALRLYSRLQHAAHSIKKASDRTLLNVSDVSTAQSAVLVTINSSERPTQRAVAITLGLDEASVTSMISRLMKLGYVDRQRCPDDARAWRLSVSPAGEKILEVIREPFMQINRKIDESVGLKNIEQLANTLDALSQEFSKQK